MEVKETDENLGPAFLHLLPELWTEGTELNALEIANSDIDEVVLFSPMHNNTLVHMYMCLIGYLFVYALLL